MPDSLFVAQVVLVSFVITWSLRALPFLALAPLRGSATVRYLSVHMPTGLMIILAGYSVLTAHLDSVSTTLTFVTAVSVTLGLHLRWSNMMLSILGGTVVNVALATLLHH
ncbi:MAG: branched-chain amino acid transporter permease [Nocardioidaceae bacterium]